MKTKKILSILALLFVTLGIISCENDLLNGSTDMREKLVKKWSVTENSSSFGKQDYEVVIDTDASDSTKILLMNFSQMGLDNNIKATLNGNILTLVEKTVNGLTYRGGATISSDYKTITWNFQVNDGNGWEDYTATFTEAKVIVKRKQI